MKKCYRSFMRIHSETTALQQELGHLGLSSKSAQVYASLFELGTAFPSKIAEQTHLNRSTVYKILTDLSVKGLVTSLERKGKLCYQIEKPSKLIHFTQTQIKLAEERYERAQKVLPELEGLFALTPQKPRVRFFEGLEGILSVYEDHIAGTEPYEMLGYSNVEALMKLLPTRFISTYVKTKARLRIKTRGIFPKTDFAEKYNKQVYQGIPAAYLVQSRFIPANTFPYEAEVTVYGHNKVSIINFHQNVLIGVIIEDETISGMLRMSFELAWKGAGNT